MTLSWLLGQLPRWRRPAWWAGTVSAVFLLVDMVIVGGAAATGDTSHFNVCTPLAACLWSVMAASNIIVRAHTVGRPDGGPGLPLLGWSTEAGDLRVSHFVGMHALQVIPPGVLVLELGARRIPLLPAAMMRLGLVWILAVSYPGILAQLTVQALAGQ